MSPQSLPPDAFDNIRYRVFAATMPCLFIATVSAALRFHVRVTMVRKLGHDDWALAMTWALLLGVGITVILGMALAVIYVVDIKDVVLWWKIIFCSIIIYQLAIATAKAAFLLQYRRCFPLPTFQRVCDVLLVFMVLWGVASTLTVIFTCIPIEGDWARTPPYGYINRVVFWYINATVNIVTDITIYVLPIPLLRQLPVGKLQKIGLIAAFSIGFFTCAISVIRICTLGESITNLDPTWYTTMPGIWSVVELCCAVVCVCVPTLRPLIRAGTSSSPTQAASIEMAYRRNCGWSNIDGLGRGQQLALTEAAEGYGSYTHAGRSQVDSEIGVGSAGTLPATSLTVREPPRVKSRLSSEFILAGDNASRISTRIPRRRSL